MTPTPIGVETTVLGVDPGTAITGYGVVGQDAGRRVRLLECGVIRTSAGQPLPRRLKEILLELRAIMDRFEPDVVAVEDVFQLRASKARVNSHSHRSDAARSEVRNQPCRAVRQPQSDAIATPHTQLIEPRGETFDRLLQGISVYVCITVNERGASRLQHLNCAFQKCITEGNRISQLAHLCGGEHHGR